LNYNALYRYSSTLQLQFNFTITVQLYSYSSTVYSTL